MHTLCELFPSLPHSLRPHTKEGAVKLGLEQHKGPWAGASNSKVLHADWCQDSDTEVGKQRSRFGGGLEQSFGEEMGGRHVMLSESDMQDQEVTTQGVKTSLPVRQKVRVGGESHPFSPFSPRILTWMD